MTKTPAVIEKNTAFNIAAAAKSLISAIFINFLNCQKQQYFPKIKFY
jgi:hypothetical protein